MDHVPNTHLLFKLKLSPSMVASTICERSTALSMQQQRHLFQSQRTKAMLDLIATFEKREKEKG